MTPVPDATLDPQVPDSNRHVFSCGADYKFEYKILKGTVGLAYTYLFQETRTKSSILATNKVALPINNQANGTYRGNNHSLGISISTEF
jgi:long-subunit fatty acid transport protein